MMPKKFSIVRSIVAASLAVALSACGGVDVIAPTPAGHQGETPSGSEVAYLPVTFDQLPGWGRDDEILKAIEAFRRSCAAISKQTATKPMGPAALNLRYIDWRPSCTELLLADMNAVEAREFLERHFQPVRLTGDAAQSGLFTGYYEIELEASRKFSSTYRYPIYRRPPDLPDGAGANGKPAYFTRGQIDRGALKNRGLEIFWVKDPVALFFLHVQGSGRLKLPGGKVARVGFAGNNGHPFVALGKVMLERGLLKQGNVTAQSVMAWLRQHPKQAPTLMAENPRYIFFKEITGSGPVGAQGVALTEGRSLAVDPRYVPLGAPLWLDTTWPNGAKQAGKPLRRLMIAQDTGSAITGPVRGDVFWGTGASALKLAGGMKQGGQYFLLLPKAPVPVAAR